MMLTTRQYGTSAAPASRVDEPAMLDRLEPRVLLDAAPFPTLDLLENPDNPIVRIETSMGTVDIELFADAAPGTVANFLARVGGGEFERSAFHRLLPGQLLELGPRRVELFNSEPRIVRTPLSDAGTHIPPFNPFPPQTLDLSDPELAASQWTVSITELHVNVSPPNVLADTSLTINLTDSPTDPLPGNVSLLAFSDSRVIGRILPGMSRDVVMTIASLGTVDLSAETPLVFGDRTGDITHDFPVTALPAPGTVPAPDEVVWIGDAELIKAAGQSEFFEHRLYYPEGFAGETISEFVPIANPNDAEAAYQLIARFETGERDMVVASGTIVANSRGGITISRITDPDGRLVPEGRPYALELQSTLPLAAALSHYDFGAATGEGFTDAPTETWFFADAVVDEDFHGFLIWQNTAADDANVEILFYPEGAEGELVPTAVITGALRRGGLDLSQMGLPEGRYGIRVVSDQPIVAALSQYDNRGSVEAASTELGVPQTVARGGALPLSQLGGSITMFNPADPRLVYLIDPTAQVTVTFTSADRSRDPVQRTFSVSQGQIIRYDFAELTDELGTAPFAVNFSSDNFVVFRGARGTLGDDAASPFSPVAAEAWRFAEGFMDPARAGTEVFETLGVFNTMNNLTVQNDITVTIRFADGTSVSEVFSLSPSRHLFLDLHTFAPLLEQAAAGRNFYSIDVTSQFPVVAQLWHDDTTLGGEAPAGGFGTIGAPYGAVVPINGPLVIVPFS